MLRYGKEDEEEGKEKKEEGCDKTKLRNTIACLKREEER